MAKHVDLKPVKAPEKEFDAIERRIKEHFKKAFFYPLLALLREPKNTLKNDDRSEDVLKHALESGKLTYNRGIFSGKFNAAISKALRDIGAKPDRQSKEPAWRINPGDLPFGLQEAIRESQARFVAKIADVEKKLLEMNPEQVASGVSLSDLFDKTISKVDKELRGSLGGLLIAPELTERQKKKISDEWQTNMQLDIKKLIEAEILELRKKVRASTFAGNRYGSLIQGIQQRYDVTANKAKFWARQETRLLTVKFQESRYVEAGVPGYRWKNVTGTPDHPVRPRHRALGDASKAGKIFYWTDPPVTTEPGEPERRNNAGQDYNCRCWAVPVVEFKK